MVITSVDSAIQCLINRDLVSKGVCLYLQFIRTFLWKGFYISWQHENVLSCGSLYLRFVPFRMKWETRWQSTYLTLRIHQKPNQCTLRRSQSTVFRNLLFTSVLNHRTKRFNSKILAMERCSDQTMKGKKRKYYRKQKVLYSVWETSAEIPRWWRVTSVSDWSCCAGNLLQPIRNTTQIWVVTRHQYGISALVSQTSFHGESSDGRREMSAVFFR